MPPRYSVTSWILDLAFLLGSAILLVLFTQIDVPGLRLRNDVLVLLLHPGLRIGIEPGTLNSLGPWPYLCTRALLATWRLLVRARRPQAVVSFNHDSRLAFAGYALFSAVGTLVMMFYAESHTYTSVAFSFVSLFISSFAISGIAHCITHRGVTNGGFFLVAVFLAWVLAGQLFSFLDHEGSFDPNGYFPRLRRAFVWEDAQDAAFSTIAIARIALAFVICVFIVNLSVDVKAEDREFGGRMLSRIVRFRTGVVGVPTLLSTMLLFYILTIFAVATGCCLSTHGVFYTGFMYWIGPTSMTGVLTGYSPRAIDVACAIGHGTFMMGVCGVTGAIVVRYIWKECILRPEHVSLARSSVPCVRTSLSAPMTRVGLVAGLSYGAAAWLISMVGSLLLGAMIVMVYVFSHVYAHMRTRLRRLLLHLTWSRREARKRKLLRHGVQFLFPPLSRTYMNGKHWAVVVAVFGILLYCASIGLRMVTVIGQSRGTSESPMDGQDLPNIVDRTPSARWWERSMPERHGSGTDEEKTRH